MTFSFLQWKFQNKIHNVKIKQTFYSGKRCDITYHQDMQKNEKFCVLALFHNELGKLKCNLKLSLPRRVCLRIIRI